MERYRKSWGIANPLLVRAHNSGSCQVYGLASRSASQLAKRSALFPIPKPKMSIGHGNGDVPGPINKEFEMFSPNNRRIGYFHSHYVNIRRCSDFSGIHICMLVEIDPHVCRFAKRPIHKTCHKQTKISQPANAERDLARDSNRTVNRDRGEIANKCEIEPAGISENWLKNQ